MRAIIYPKTANEAKREKSFITAGADFLEENHVSFFERDRVNLDNVSNLIENNDVVVFGDGFQKEPEVVDRVKAAMTSGQKLFVHTGYGRFKRI